MTEMRAAWAEAGGLRYIAVQAETVTDDAPLVIGLGPGFAAGVDCHVVVETNRGHHLGRLIHHGSAEPDTGMPGDIAGYRAQRVLRAPLSGVFQMGSRPDQSQPKSEKRNPPPFSLRLTFEERARLERDAGDMPLGAYIRSRLFDQPAGDRRKPR